MLVACAWLLNAQLAHAQGFQLEAELKHGAFHVPGAPNVIVHAGPAFDARAPLRLVVYLHGYSACVRVLMARGDARCKAEDRSTREGWDLGRVHAEAHTNTLFIVPQLAYLKRDGDPGGFARRGELRAFLDELLQGPLASRLGGARSLRDVARIDLVAHSGGYRAALALLERGGIDPPQLHGVVLLDALYGETASFARYVERHLDAGLVFVTVSLPHGKPERESRSLGLQLERKLGAGRVTFVPAAGIATAIARQSIVIAQGIPPHRLVPATQLAEILGALETR